MRELPPMLRRYLWLTYLCGLAVILLCARTSPLYPSGLAGVFGVGLFVLLTFLTDVMVISYSTRFQQTVSTAMMFAAAFLFPPFSVVSIVVPSTALGDAALKKPWFKILFNIAYRSIVFGLVSLSIYYFQIDLFQFTTLAEVSKILGLFTLYLVLSIGLLGCVLVLLKGADLRSGWREIVGLINPYDIALGPYGLTLAWLWHQSVWHFLLGLIPLIAIQHAFAVHAGLLNEQEASAKLTAQQRQLQDATTTLLSVSDIHTQLDTFMRHVMEVFPVSRANVLLWGEGKEPAQVVSRGACEPDLPILDWSDNLRRVCQARRLVQLDQEFVTRVMGGRPVLLVPLVTPDDIVGCMVLVGDESLSLDEGGERLIETFAAQAALAIYQARLITRLKSSQVRVVQSERLAAIGTLAAGVAHEFNNLLAGISGIAQLALMDDSGTEQREALSTVAQAAQQGGSITRGLLTFARHLEPKREQANIRSAIDPVLSMLQAEFRRANITVERRLAPVPPLYCDVGMLSQVMLNLVTNAIDAMASTGGTLRIELFERAGEIVVVVADTGSGIPAHVRDRIFEPFVSTKTSNDGKLHGGSGLGLAISYGIITDHGGTIDVVSEIGQGTTMTLHLPLSAPGAGPQPEQPLEREQLRMIVVDDEPLIAKSLHGMLVRDGHVAEWYSQASEALDAIGHAPVDVIFADLMMPEMDGVTLLEQARRRVPSATQVVVTGQIDPRQLERVHALGVSAVIEKPFSMDAIREVVRDLRPVSA